MERKRITEVLVMKKKRVIKIPLLEVKHSKAEEDELSDMLLNVMFEACVEKKEREKKLFRIKLIKIHLHF